MILNKKKIIIYLFLIIFLLNQNNSAISITTNNEGDWTQFRYNNNHIGFQTTEGNANLSQYDIKWFKQMGDSHNDLIYGEPSVADLDFDGEKEIIFGSDNSSLYCLNKDGDLKWQFLTEGRISSTPTLINLNNDKNLEIIIGDGSGKIFAISADGKLIWEYETEKGIDASAAVGDITGNGDPDIVIGSYDENIYTISKDGELIWKYDTGNDIVATAVIIDINGDNKNDIIVGGSNGIMYAITTKKIFEKIGIINRTKYLPDILWEFETPTPNNLGLIGSPVIKDINEDGKYEVIFGSEDGTIFCLDTEGNKLWDYKTDGPIFNTPAVVDIDNDGIIDIITNSGNNLIAININKKLLWQRTFSMRIGPNPVILDIDGDNFLEIITIDKEMKTIEPGMEVDRWINGTNILNYKGEVVHRLKFCKEIYDYHYGISVVDLENDGKLEIITGTYYGFIYCYGETNISFNDNDNNNEGNNKEKSNNKDSNENNLPSLAIIIICIAVILSFIYLKKFKRYK